MSTAIDINSMPIVGIDPDGYDPELAQEARRCDIAEYVDAWCRGNLAEPPGRDIYYEPIERLTEDDWLIQLLAAKDDEALLAAAKIVQSQLRKFVEEQAEEAV